MHLQGSYIYSIEKTNSVNGVQKWKYWMRESINLFENEENMWQEGDKW